MGVLDWQADALCAETDPEVFFPEKGGSTAGAKAVCASCDIRDQCLEWALANSIDDGVWGGRSPRERDAIRSARRSQANATRNTDATSPMASPGAHHRAEQRARLRDLLDRGYTSTEIAVQLRISPEAASARIKRLRHEEVAS